ncbi:hypothetical protein EVAR_39681_1 [Eumeta japonica]|uniref:Uncharacterized protein n=1 Tax=Eumeta variegata TaxID=151549 RepID=A0A4C1Z6P5_EUMVA|nr:hypothetical protein EVAR_39681_1 [Eumeta japonica]
MPRAPDQEGPCPRGRELRNFLTLYLIKCEWTVLKSEELDFTKSIPELPDAAPDTSVYPDPEQPQQGTSKIKSGRCGRYETSYVRLFAPAAGAGAGHSLPAAVFLQNKHCNTTRSTAGLSCAVATPLAINKNTNKNEVYSASADSTDIEMRLGRLCDRIFVGLAVTAACAPPRRLAIVLLIRC